MIPNLNFLGRSISVYQILILVGVFTAGIYACRSAGKKGCDENDMIVLLLVSAVGVFFGMHLLYGLTNLPMLGKLLQNPEVITDFQSFLQAVFLIFGGAVFYGGLLGGLLAGFLYCRKKRMDLQLWSDLAAPAIPLFHFFGRIGCFLGGCCYGVPCSLGFTYHHSPLPGANDVVRFPIQLVEAGWNLALFLVLSRLQRRGKLPGRLLTVYLMSYAPARFVFEFFRGDRHRGFLLGLSTSQWISILILLGCSVYLFREKKKKNP